MYGLRQAIKNSTHGQYSNVIFLFGVKEQVRFLEIKYQRSARTQDLRNKLARTKIDQPLVSWR